MTQEEFADTAAESGVLSLEESHNLFLYFNGKKQDLPFISTPRQGLIVVNSTTTLLNIMEVITGGYVDFTVDRDITVLGFALYGSCNEARECRVGIRLRDRDNNNTCLGEHNTNIVVDGSPNGCTVCYFTTPITIKAGTRYQACAGYLTLHNVTVVSSHCLNVTSGNVTFNILWS